MSVSTTESSHPYRFVILGGLILFVLTMSLFVFSQQSLRLDEAQSLWQTSHTTERILEIVGEDVHVPLYHMILHFWQLAFGNGVSTARLLSLLFFVLVIPSMYILGSQAYNKTVGLFGALLISISPFMNWYGNEIRMYSLFTLLVILNQYFFIKIFRDNSEKAWWGYIITASLGMFTHYYFFLNLISQVVFYFLNKNIFPKESLKAFVRTALFLALIFTPWFLHVLSLGGASNTRPNLEAPTSINVFNTFSQFIFGFQNDHINTILVSLWPLAVLLGFLALRKNKRINPETVYFIVSILVPIIVTFTISVLYTPLYVTRYLVLTLPSLYLFLSWIISTYPDWLGKVIKVGLVAVMLFTLGIEIISAQTPVKENYREAAMYLEQHAQATDTIVVSAPFTIYPVEYYYRGPISIQTLPIWDRYKVGPVPGFEEEKLADEVARVKDGYSTIWLLQSYDQGYEETMRLYFDNNYERTDMQNFSKGLNLYAYKLKY